jgi:hypothetical protein
VDWPRFRGGLRAWDQGIWSDGILLSCLVPFFCSAGGRSHSSVPARTMMRPSHVVAVKDGPTWGPPGELVLDGREHGGRLVCVGIWPHDDARSRSGRDTRSNKLLFAAPAHSRYWQILLQKSGEREGKLP